MPTRKRKNLIETIGGLLNDLTKIGHIPTLVGGMALALLESNRVTKDFDFLIDEDARNQKEVTFLFYKHGFELVSKFDEQGRVLRTVDNANVAHAKLQMDPIKSAFFYHRGSDLRIDLLFDFPISAREVVQRATKRTIRSFLFYIADKQDLIRMKEIAVKERKNAADLQDLEFLRSLKD